jgi:RNA polymerase sigma factor (sigma-70 family)
MTHHRPSSDRTPLDKLLKALAAEFHDRLPHWQTLYRACLQNSETKRPPHWSTADWWDEVAVVAAEAAMQAAREYDPQRSPSLGGFVSGRMRQAVEQRHRQEEQFGRHWKALLEEVRAEAAPTDAGTGASNEELLQALRKELAGMAPRDRELLRLHFEKGLKESAIAARLGLSQQAISKRKLQLLEQLGRALETFR